MLWLMKQIFTAKDNAIVIYGQTVDIQITIDKFPGMLIIVEPHASSPAPSLPLCWYSS